MAQKMAHRDWLEEGTVKNKKNEPTHINVHVDNMDSEKKTKAY